MQKGFVKKGYIPVLITFIGLSLLILLLSFIFPHAGISYSLLYAGNLLLFIVGWISVGMNMGALQHKSVQGFLRLVYGSFILKFFILVTAAFIYIAHYKKDVNKLALFGCFGMYFIYTIVEMGTVMKKRKNSNA